MIAQNTNFLPNAPVHLVSPNGRVRPFGIGASTDIARGTALDAAVAAAVSGDVVRFGSGTFDLGLNQLDLPNGVSLVGPGRKAATLLAQLPKTGGAVIVPGDDSLIQGFTFNTLGYGETIQIGSQQSTLVHDKDFVRVLIRDVRSLNEIDFVQIFVSTGADADLVYDFTMEDCSTLSAFDHVSLSFEGSNPVATAVLRNCHFVGDGAYGAGSTIVHGINLGPAGGTGTASVKIYGGSLRSTGGTILNQPVNVSNNGITVELYGVHLHSAGTNAFDIKQANSATVTAYNCTGSGTNGAVTTSGTVTIAGKAADATKVANTTPGVTGLALLDDGTAAAARATIGLNTRSVQLLCVPAGTALTTGDGKGGVFFRVPAAINGWNLTGAAATVTVVSSSGTPTIQVRRVRAGTPADMLSTRITIDANELDSKDATAAAVINASNDDVATGDQIYIDCDVAGTSTEGLSVHLTFTEV